MKKYGVLTWILIKRQCKNKAFIGMLILVCLFTAVSPYISALDKDEPIYVALYGEGGEIAGQIMNELAQMECSYDFYICESRENLINDVKRTKAAAGYVFEEGFSQAIENQNYNGIISVVVNGEDIVQNMISETVFSVVFSEISRYTTVGYLTENMPEISKDYDFEQIYEEYLSSGQVFSVEFEELSDSEQGSTVTGTQKVSKGRFEFSFRNIMALFIMAAGLIGGYEWLIDREKGSFDAVRYGQKRVICVLYSLIPALMAGAVTFFCSIILGNAKEFHGMIFYVFLAGLFAWILSNIIKNSKLYAGFSAAVIWLGFIVCIVM